MSKLVILLFILPILCYSQKPLLVKKPYVGDHLLLDNLPPPMFYKKGNFHIQTPQQLSWAYKNEKMVKCINIAYNGLRMYRTGLSGHRKLIFEIKDSINVIPDSIIYLAHLQKLNINVLSSYITPLLAQMPTLKTIDIGRWSPDTLTMTKIPLMPQIRNILLSASDSLTIEKILPSFPSIRCLDIHLETQSKKQSQWNAHNILRHSPKLNTLIVPYWEGLTYASRQEIDYIMEQDTVYKRVYYLDFDLSHCKHLRKIVTDYDLSDEMQRYCRKHFISVVKFSRKRFWKKE